jgi:hypothetical protein
MKTTILVYTTENIFHMICSVRVAKEKCQARSGMLAEKDDVARAAIVLRGIHLPLMPLLRSDLELVLRELALVPHSSGGSE